MTGSKVYAVGRVRITKSASAPYWSLSYVDANGKRRVTSGTAKLPDAKRKAARINDTVEREIAKRQDPSAPSHRKVNRGNEPVSVLLGEFADPMNHATWGKRYAVEVERRVRLHIVPVLDRPGLLCNQLTVARLEKVLTTARSRGLAAASLQSLRTTLRSVLTFGVTEGFLSPELIPQFHKVKVYVNLTLSEGDVPTRAMVVDVANAFRNLTSTRDVVGREGRWLQVWLAEETGLRLGEMNAMPVSNFDGSACSLLVDRTIAEPGESAPFLKATKSDRSRTVWVPRWLADMLTVHCERMVERFGPDALIFPNPSGKPVQLADGRTLPFWSRRNFTRRFSKARAQAGWPKTENGKFIHTWHALRHTAAIQGMTPVSEGGWGRSLGEQAKVHGHHDPAFHAKVYQGVMDDFGNRQAQTAEARTERPPGA